MEMGQQLYQSLDCEAEKRIIYLRWREFFVFSIVLVVEHGVEILVSEISDVQLQCSKN